jgi:cytochrome c
MAGQVLSQVARYRDYWWSSLGDIALAQDRTGAVKEKMAMRTEMKLIATAVMALALAGCGGAKQDDAAAESDAGSSASSAGRVAAAGARPAAYAQCASCHSVEPGKHGLGPSLHGVYGTKAGDIPGFVFSEKLKASGLVWDDATLDQWQAGPMKMVPGTKMSYAGMNDPAQRAQIIAYMKTLK